MNTANEKIRDELDQENLAAKIRNKALELGFDSCGIVKVDAVRDYADRLEERTKLFPESRPLLENFYKYAYGC